MKSDKLPMVMPTNLRLMVERLNARFPGRMGMLIGPTVYAHPREQPYALDNDRFSVWSKGKEWSESAYMDFVHKVHEFENKPMWMAVPDVVTNAAKTFEWWKKWTGYLQQFPTPLALVVQDGMTAEQVRRVTPRPEVIFVGGSTDWKWRTLKQWTLGFPRVHVGRVNSRKLLWGVHRAGAESSDGTRWWTNKQFAQLVKYLEQSSAGQCDSRKGFFRRY
jgi:hypothetical protein